MTCKSVYGVHTPLSSPNPLGAAHERGHAGGGWSNGGSDPQSSQSGQFRPTPTTSSHHHHHHHHHDDDDGDDDVEEHLSSTGEDLSSYEQTSIEQEQRLVDDITAPGGVRAAPPRESLNKFVARCVIYTTWPIAISSQLSRVRG